MQVRDRSPRSIARRVAQLAGAFAAGALVVALTHQPSAPVPVALFAPAAAPPGPDLRDINTRAGLRTLADNPYRRLAVGQPSLYHQCGEGMVDTVSLIGSHAFRRPEDEYVEIRRNDGDAGATIFQLSGVMLAPPEPGAPALAPVDSRRRILPVDAATLAEVESLVLGLWRERLAPLRWENGGTDGSFLALEFCWRGQYGYFLRRSPDPALPDDGRILAVANRLFALAGARQLTP